MNFAQVLTSDLRHLELCVADTAPAGIERLLESVVFGTSGLRYQRRQVRGQLERFNKPVFISLQSTNELVGVYVLDQRQLCFRDQPILGIYRGMLSVASDFQGRGLGKQLGHIATAWMEEIADKEGCPVLTFGFVEASNTRSNNLLKSLDHQVLGQQDVFLVYRQNPQQEIMLTPFTTTAFGVESVGLELTHADCLLRDITPSSLPGFAVTDQHGVRVSARVAIIEIAPQSLGKTADWMVRLLVRPFAPARKRFDGRVFRFLKLTDLVLRPGCEDDWQPFVSSLLHQHNMYFASVQLATDSALLTRLQRLRAFSPWLQPAAQQVQILGRPVGTIAKESLHNLQGPHHLVAVDF